MAKRSRWSLSCRHSPRSSWRAVDSPHSGCDVIFSSSPGSRRALPAWRHLGRSRHQLRVFSAHAERIELCLFDPTGRRELARFDYAGMHRRNLARLSPQWAARSGLRLPRPRPIQSAGRSSLQPAQAAARSLRAAVRRRIALVRRAVRLPRAFAPRRPFIRPPRQRARHAERRRQRRHLRLGRRSAARICPGRGP